MVQGLTQWQQRWKNIPKRMRREVSAEMEDIADEIVAVMYGAAPQLTGDLAMSIRWTWGDAPRGALVIGNVGENKYAAMRITIYAGGTEATRRRQNRSSGTRARDRYRSGSFDTDVAILQEFGTQNMAPNPFFFPVWRVKRRSVKARITRIVRRVIRTA